MTHDVNIDMHAELNVLEFGFPVVGNNPPVARVDQREEWTTRMSVGSFGDIHVCDIGIERRHHAAAFEVEPRAENFRSFCRTFREKRLDSVDSVSSLTQPCCGF